MSQPILLVQLSDSHIGADWGDGDPAARLVGAVDAVRGLEPAPLAVLVTGDLVDHALDAEYEQLRGLLEPLQAPLYVLPGNHDDRAALRRHFDVPGEDADFVQYSVDLGPLRRVVMDTTRPGEDGGELDAERLAWLDAELALMPEAPTVIALHHPPIVTGIPAMDVIGLPVADRAALGKVIERHPQVLALVAGHIHRTIHGTLAGRSVLVGPSTHVQLELDFRSDEIRVRPAPPGFAVHALLDGRLVSHVQSVGSERWASSRGGRGGRAPRSIRRGSPLSGNGISTTSKSRGATAPGNSPLASARTAPTS